MIVCVAASELLFIVHVPESKTAGSVFPSPSKSAGASFADCEPIDVVVIDPPLLFITEYSVVDTSVRHLPISALLSPSKSNSVDPVGTGSDNGAGGASTSGSASDSTDSTGRVISSEFTPRSFVVMSDDAPSEVVRLTKDAVSVAVNDANRFDVVLAVAM